MLSWSTLLNPPEGTLNRFPCEGHFWLPELVVVLEPLDEAPEELLEEILQVVQELRATPEEVQSVH